jgi:uncharacterized protein
MNKGSTAVMISQDQLEGATAYWVTNVTRDTTLARRALVASTVEARRVGLLNHESLPAGEGLLIVPAKSIHTVGMRFSIDVAFLAEDGRVIHLYSCLDQGRIVSCAGARSVLELPAGMLAKTGTQPDDQLSFAEVCA